jgi:[CysO sulfur-carrier protein]-S-L-cysteine hydrolase
VDGVLTIDREIVEAIVAHARRDHPDEACGVVAGPAGKDLPLRHVPMENAERSTTFYRFDSMEQLRVWREMDDLDEEPVVIYHSHTGTEAYPSRTDIALAGEPNAHYVLVSTRDPQTAEIRSFRIVDGQVAEEPVSLAGEIMQSMRLHGKNGDSDAVQSYMFGQSPSTVDYECQA